MSLMQEATETREEVTARPGVSLATRWCRAALRIPLFSGDLCYSIWIQGVWRVDLAIIGLLGGIIISPRFYVNTSELIIWNMNIVFSIYANKYG